MRLEIPVKPYTLKFLQRHLGPDYKLSKVDPYGLHLFSMLRRQLQDRHYDSMLASYTARFAVNFEPGQIFDRGCRELTSRTTVDFNNWVESIFKHEFHTYVDVKAEHAVPVFTAIRQFCAKHELSEEDIAQETLRTSYKRYLKKRPKSAVSPSTLNQAA